jgi:hypothetical protein
LRPIEAAHRSPAKVAEEGRHQEHKMKGNSVSLEHLNSQGAKNVLRTATLVLASALSAFGQEAGPTQPTPLFSASGRS